MNKKLVLGTLVCGSLAVVMLAGCSKEEVKGKIEDGEVKTSSTKLKDGSEIKTEDLTLKDDGYFTEIVKGDENPKIIVKAEYNVDWKDSSWENVDFEIDKAKIVEVDKIKDDDENTFKGLLSLHYFLENKGKEDVKIHPKKATLVLKDDKEIEGSHFIDYWEDIFKKDKKRDGYVHFKFKDIDEMDDIKEVKLDFDGHKDGDVDDKVDHDFTIKLPLDNPKK